MSKSKFKQFAKSLRTNATDTEQLLWQHLRGHRFFKVKFKRQQPIGEYIVDFISFKSQLIIELDGGQHAEQKEYDESRSNWLRSQGFEIIRFWNNEVIENLEGVLMVIAEKLGMGDFF
ncbi:MAG TPA: endonuclease domain-containing protein [Gammaproteobacteria bacterium]|nr:endonuclease domain-containing protein [Gammaproteobacteria bacterium]